MTSPYQHPQAGDAATPPEYGVRASYTANIANLAAATTTCDTAVTLVEGDLVLLTEQTAGAENGIYVVGPVANGAAPLTRWEKCRSAAGLPPGTTVFVSEGTARGNHKYVLTTNAPIVLDTTVLVFAVESFTTHDHSNAANGGLIAAAGVTPGTAYQVLRTNAGGTATEMGSPMAIAPAANLPAHVANDIIPTAIVSGAVYDIPALDAASTITLPATSPDGTYCWITGDGVKNDQTVQVRDANGPTNLTTALTASKRLCVFCVKTGGKWYANAYVSP